MKKYDSYKDSGVEWIGKVPANWGISKVKFLFDTQKGKTPKNLLDKIEENSLVYLAMDYLRGEPKQVFFVSNNENVVLTEENETLLLWDGSNAGEFLKSKKGVLSSTMALIKSKIIDNQFQWYSFKSFESILKDSCNGMGIPHVDGKFFRGSAFLVPPIEEQQAIVNYLDNKTTKIDDLISKKEEFIQLLEEERVAVINQAVTKGLDPTVPMKDSGIDWLGEIPEHWEVKKLKHITSKVTDGSHFSPPTESEGRFYISVTDITKSNSINFENSKRISDNSFDELARNGCKPIKGDILITKDGTIGRGVIVEDFDDFVILSSLGLIRLNNKQNPYYILFYLLSGLNIDQMYSNIRGSGITRLTIKLINDLIVVVPSFEEQIEIENYLKLKTNEIDKIIIKSKQEIELLNEYKTALISEVVTGKVDVRNEKLN